MAIISVNVPDQQSIAYRPIIYTWGSNAANLQYCIVEVTLPLSTRVAASSVQPDAGTTDEFTVNISDIIQDNLSFTPKTLGSSGVLTNDTGVVEYVNLKIYEVTESGGALVTNYDPSDDNNSNYDYYTGAIPGTEVIGYNWTESHFDYNGFDISDYEISGTSKKFLSEAPLVKDIELSVNEFIGILYYDGVSSKNYKLEVLTYDSSDSLLNTDYINITDWNTGYGTIATNTYLSLAVGTTNLIAAGISLTNVSYYDIKVINDDGDKSETRRYNIVGDCDQDVRVHWANKFGKQDTYTFKGNKIESLTHSSNTYLKALGNTYSSASRGASVSQNISTSNFEIFTNSLSRTDYEFLASMLVTKQAWIEDNGSYYPIIIEDGTRLIRNEKNVPIQFNLSYSFANSTKGLRG